MAVVEEKVPWQVYYCDYCQEDVSLLRLECAECQDFDLCPECFASGAEMGQHKKTHSYKLVHYMPLFPAHSSWGALEELMLITKVFKFGYGNWEMLAQEMKTRTPEEIEKHFNEIYVDGNMGKVIFSSVEPRKISADQTETYSVVFDSYESATQNLSEGLSKELDFMPRRGEFKNEYDDDAESELYTILSCFNDDEDEVCAALKSASLDIYQQRVRKRHIVRKLLWEYDLLRKYDEQINKTQQLRMSKDESALREKLKVFCRFMPSKDFDNMVENMLKERKLKAVIKELQAKIVKQYSKGVSKSTSKVYPMKGRVKGNKLKKVSLPASSSNQKQAAQTGWECIEATPTPSPSQREDDEIKEPPSSINYLNFLSRSEKRLCSNLDLEPSCYVALKSMFLKDRNVLKEPGQVVQSSASFPPEMNDRVQKVAAFLSKNGWICPG